MNDIKRVIIKKVSKLQYKRLLDELQHTTDSIKFVFDIYNYHYYAKYTINMGNQKIDKTQYRSRYIKIDNLWHIM